MESFLASTKETTGISEASKMMGGDTIVLPMLVFGTRPTDKGRMITGMIAPLSHFTKQGVKGYHFNRERKRNEIEVIQDIRSGDKRTADQKFAVELDSYQIHEMPEIEGKVDTDEEMCRARRIIGEGDIVTVFFGKSEEEESNIAPGYLVVLNYCISCYHKAIKNDKGVILRKEISLFENIESVRLGISVPISIVADWLQSMNLMTQQFRSRVGELIHYMENTPGISDEKLKTQSYRLSNYCMIPLGWPADARHPNIGRADSNILVNTTPPKEVNFQREDKKAKVPKGESAPMLPKIEMSMKGYQWKGERTSNNYDPEDVVFAIDMIIFDRALAPFKIRSPKAWVALIPSVFDLMEGVIVAKENLLSGIRAEGNAGRIAELGAGASAEEMDAKLNGPVGENKPSFVLKLNSEALIVDPVHFVQRVGFRVTSKRLIEYWGGKKTARKEDYVTKSQKIDFGSPLLCLTEAYGKSLEMIFAQPDNYEFRILTNVIPTAETLSNVNKHDLYDELSDMSPEYGDQFLDFAIKGLSNGKTTQQYAKTAGSKLAKDHPCRSYNFQLFNNDNLVVYVFAINMLHLASQYKSAEEQLTDGGLTKLITGSAEDNEPQDDASAKDELAQKEASPPKKKGKKRMATEMAASPRSSPAKRSRRTRQSTTPAPEAEAENPDEIDIDQADASSSSSAQSSDESSAEEVA